jgi:hypothetical protein
MHARLDRGAVKLLTRTGLDWSVNIRRSPRPWPGSMPFFERSAPWSFRPDEILLLCWLKPNDKQF